MIQLFTPETPPNSEQQEKIIDFLFEALEQYGDPKEQIASCLKYAMKERESFGGLVAIYKDENRILGATIINNTGMGGYIPEHILVYIATHPDTRGKGIGRQLIDAVTEALPGDIALHVEPENPAKRLYEKVGFTNKYLEMRYQAKK